MARPPKGKPLTFRPVRFDDNVWAEFQRLGKLHGTINEGARVVFGWTSPLISQGLKPVAVEKVASGRSNKKFDQRPFKGPIPKPKDKK